MDNVVRLNTLKLTSYHPGKTNNHEQEAKPESVGSLNQVKMQLQRE